MGGIDGDVINEESSPFPPSLPPPFLSLSAVLATDSNCVFSGVGRHNRAEKSPGSTWGEGGREGVLGVRIRLS